MSGAPIIQNGKFVGAVTHVLVNDPTIGYGVFADIMLKQMKENGLTYQDYVSINGGDEKALEEQRKAEALKNIKASLVVNKIMLSEGLGVTQQMLDAQYQSIADQYKMTLEDVKKLKAWVQENSEYCYVCKKWVSKNSSHRIAVPSASGMSEILCYCCNDCYEDGYHTYSV